VAVRYPRGAGVGVALGSDLSELPWGRAELRRSTSRTSAVGGPRIAILAFGTLLYPALQAAEALDATVVNMRFVKPLDEALLLELARSHTAFVTVEDNAIAGGAGSAVAEFLATHGIVMPFLQLGLPDAWLEHMSREQMLASVGLDPAGITAAVLKRWPKLPHVARVAQS
jgi:1-deoxy-D-xylulose-5-phosphate synthase